MPQTVPVSGVTFAVDDVDPAATPLEECRAHEAVRDLLGSDIESCSDYHGTVVADVLYQPLLAAVYRAFTDHRPVVLTPDAVWLTIAQGVAHHMLVHGEGLRSRFVTHQGKLDLTFEAPDWVGGSPENPWPDAFASWAGQIRDHVGTVVHDSLVCDFGTSGPVERAASHVVMMDVFERYFHYVAVCACGIPAVTLEGTPGDWERLREKAAALRVFDLDWWLAHLLPVCDQFVRASRGDVDREHWQDICKRRRQYGGDIINGWVAKLFPYLRAFIGGPCTRRNPVFETGEGFQSWVAPLGLSRVPVTWRDARTGRERMLEAVGGLVGVSQDAGTGALRPKVGWAVRAAEKLDVLLGRVVNGHATSPGTRIEESAGLPTDLCAFYHRTDGVDLFGRGAEAAVRVFPHAGLSRLGWGEVDKRLRDNDYPNGQTWYRLAALAGGSWLAINPRPECPEPYRTRRDANWQAPEWRHFAAICHGSPGTEGVPGRNPVVALSFTELLERLLDSDGRPYWQAAGFTAYGDAEAFTRRR